MDRPLHLLVSGLHLFRVDEVRVTPHVEMNVERSIEVCIRSSQHITQVGGGVIADMQR